MGVEPSQPQPQRVRHIVISGTSFWNPGDDFVRDGVIRVLHAVFPGEQLNFLFYNFNADFFPLDKFRGIANQVSAGDLERLCEHVDAVVIAGLSAGEEIKDLYRWVIANGLEDRVYLIGAGYESGYAAEHAAAEPEATIFRRARVIIGRTRRVAPFIEQSRIPYHHLNCPAILSVERVKDIPVDRRIGKIGFSLQLPHGIGVVNHACDESMYRLGLELLTELARHLPVEFVAHHKSEYFHFLDLFRARGLDIPVLFSSFYRDLHAIYPRYDLVVTTRLHASLFANGFGIPGIILNDTDRHTQTLEGFPHSVWVRDRGGFDNAFTIIAGLNLRQIAADAELFKQDLLRRYVGVLRPAFATGRSAGAADPAPDDPRVRAAAAVSAGAAARAVKERVLGVLERLQADHYLVRNRERYRAAIESGEDWCDSVSVLNWFAREFRPRTYLEVGVRRGRSMAQVLTQSPQTQAYGFDLWIPGYGSRPDEGIEVSNPGPEFVLNELARLGVATKPVLVAGDSAETLPRFFAEPGAPAEVDLIYIDGDHGYAGAKRDLDIAFDHLAAGGMLVFDDIAHPSHPELLGLWNEYRARYPQLLFMEDMSGTGTGVAIRPPFTRYRSGNDAGATTADKEYTFDSELNEQKLVRRLVGPGMTVLDVGANIGKYSRLFSLLTGTAGRVVAFEASPATASGLAEDLRRDGCANVSVVAAAVFSKRGSVKLNEFPREYCSWNSIGTPRMEDPGNPARMVPIERTVDVPAVTLDEYCAENSIAHVHYLKLDVEGVEIEALKGARRLLESKSVDWVQFEISRKMLEGAGTTARAVFDFLAEAGYEVHRITAKGAIGRRVTDSSAFYENYIAFPDNARELANHPFGRLPVHFFTIVLNGEPFIRHHIEVMRRLPFHWHWHIVEGVADLKHDTAWSVSHGGRITDALHDNGLSHDGTSRYLEEIERQYPDRITVYRKPAGQFWDGKLEMVNAPLEYIDRECLLWQIDADELWQYEQWIDGYLMFLHDPGKTAAFYYCHYFVGPDLVTVTRDTYGNHTDYEWLRTWRYRPGYRWLAHEPPRLCAPDGAGGWKDLAAVNPFRHAETEALELVFQHFAYAVPEQLTFKEDYYGYRDALAQWRRLQQEVRFPVALRNYFAWVSDGAMVDRATVAGVMPAARMHVGGAWRFSAHSPVAEDPQRIVWVRTDSIGDNLLASSMLAPIRRQWPQAELTVVCQEHIAELYEHCPHVDCVLTFNKKRMYEDGAYRDSVCAQLAVLGADLVLNGVYSREPVTDLVALACRAATAVAFVGDNSNMDESTRSGHNAHYTRLIPNGAEHLPELERHAGFLRGLGIEAGELAPLAWTTAEDRALAEAFLEQSGLDPRRTIALFPGAQHDHKVYQRYPQVLSAFPDYAVLVLGGEKEAPMAQSLCDALGPRAVNAVGKLGLRQTVEVLRSLAAYLGADSAGVHLACVADIPNVVLAGGGHPGRFVPYSRLTTAVMLPLECYGCNWRCPYERPHCVRDIEPDIAIQALREVLANRSAQPVVVVQGPAQWPARPGVPRWHAPDTWFAAGAVDIRNAEMAKPAAPAADAARAATLVEQGERRYAEGDREGAVAAFAEALDVDPGNATAYGNLAALAWEAGDAAGALRFILQALKWGPDSSPVVQNAVRMLRAVGEEQQAVDLALAHLARHPEDGAVVQSAQMDADEKNEVLVSAIVSTYNSARLLQACLEDLERQSVAERMEIIVVDTGSQEDERAIVAAMQQRYRNIRYLRTEQRETIYSAWNRGVLAARGKYVTNANTDDAHHVRALERLADALEAHPEADLAYAHCVWTDVANDRFEETHGYREVRYPAWHPGLAMLFCFLGPHPLWRRDVFARLGAFNPAYRAAGDYEFQMRFVAAGLRAVLVPEVLSLFYQNRAGLTLGSDVSGREAAVLTGQYRQVIPISKLYRVQEGDAVGAALAWVAQGCLAFEVPVPWEDRRQCEAGYALYCFEQALALDPENESAWRNRIAAAGRMRDWARAEGWLKEAPARIAAALRSSVSARQPLALQAPDGIVPAVESILWPARAASKPAVSARG